MELFHKMKQLCLCQHLGVMQMILRNIFIFLYSLFCLSECEFFTLHIPIYQIVCRARDTTKDIICVPLFSYPLTY